MQECRLVPPCLVPSLTISATLMTDFHIPQTAPANLLASGFAARTNVRAIILFPAPVKEALWMFSGLIEPVTRISPQKDVSTLLNYARSFSLAIVTDLGLAVDLRCCWGAVSF